MSKTQYALRKRFIHSYFTAFWLNVAVPITISWWKPNCWELPSPDDLSVLISAHETGVGAFVEYDNHCRYHESFGNVTPADTYFGRDTAILERSNRIKKRPSIPAA